MLETLTDKKDLSILLLLSSLPSNLLSPSSLPQSFTRYYSLQLSGLSNALYSLWTTQKLTDWTKNSRWIKIKERDIKKQQLWTFKTAIFIYVSVCVCVCVCVCVRGLVGGWVGTCMYNSVHIYDDDNTGISSSAATCSCSLFSDWPPPARTHLQFLYTVFFHHSPFFPSLWKKKVTKIEGVRCEIGRRGKNNFHKFLRVARKKKVTIL